MIRSKALLLIPALAIAVLATACSKKEEQPAQEFNQMPQQQQQTMNANSDAAPGFTLTKVGGGKKSLSDYQGKVVMVNFWATWCGPCKREIPDFVELQNEYKDKGFEIVGIALDEPADVETFVDNSSINYDILHGNQDIAMAYGNIRSIPTTFLLNRDGEIVKKYVGMQPKSTWATEINAIL
ncbi:MAG: redoxin [Ectothiorhodospiraceae bacterium]|nr:redoxin [Ectothiorhodospiraceae bacterium]